MGNFSRKHAPDRREIRLFLSHDFDIYGNSVGDTVAFDPATGGIAHYKGQRYFLANGFSENSGSLGGCPKILFCYGRLQIPRAALARSKSSHRRHSHASGAFDLAVLPDKFSLALATKLFSDSLLAQFATGQKGIGGKEGTFKDAEDGHLSGNPIAQGSVDSLIGLNLMVDGMSSGNASYWIAAGQNWDEVSRLDSLVKKTSGNFDQKNI